MAETEKQTSPGRPIRETRNMLHPRIYALMIALACWFIVSVWIFSGVGSTDYLLAIVSGFIFFAALGLPLILSRLRRSSDELSTFRAWESGDFDTWTGPMRGSHAAAEILLPIAAVAFGMTAFGIVLHLVELGST